MRCEEDCVFSKIWGFIVVGKCTYLAQSIIIGSLMVILERSEGVVSLKALSGCREKIREMEQISKLRLVCSLHHLKKEKHDKLKNRRGSSILKTRKKKKVLLENIIYLFSCFLGAVLKDNYADFKND